MENDFFPSHHDEERRIATSGNGSVPAPKPDKQAASTQDVATESAIPETRTVRIIDKIATAFSWILVPLNMPLFGLWFLFGLSILTVLPTAFKWELTGIFFGLDIIVPMGLIFLLKWFGLVDDLGLNGRKERLIPYLISIAVLVGSGYWCQRLGLPLWVAGFYYGGAVAGAFNLIVNFRWKISAHAAAMAGVLALLVRLWTMGNTFGPIETWILIWIVLTGLLGASRIWLGRHTPMQVLCGSIVGFVAVYFMTFI